MKSLIAFIFATAFANPVLAATELSLKENLPSLELGNFAEQILLTRCQPTASHTPEIRVFSYQYKKTHSSPDGSATLQHQITVIFDYKGLYEDYVVLKVAEAYPTGGFTLVGFQHPDICLGAQ